MYFAIKSYILKTADDLSNSVVGNWIPGEVQTKNKTQKPDNIP